MRKKLLSILLIVSLLMQFCSGIGQAFVLEEVVGITWRYDSTGDILYIDGSGPIEDYDVAEGNKVSPGGWTLAPWGDYRQSAEMIIISGATSIGENAFAGFKAVECVVLPDTVQEIESGAFADCALTEIKLPDSIITIAPTAFADTPLETAYGSGDGFVENWAMENDCEYVEVFDEGSCGSTLYWMMVEDDALIIYGSGAMDDFKYIGIYPWKDYADTTKSVVLKPGVTHIGEFAFAVMPITSAKIPNSVASLGASAFDYCEELTEIYLPENLRTIGDSAFSGCESLEIVGLPENLETIEEEAFYDCSALKEIAFPDSLETIGNEAFYGCSSLATVDLGNGVEKIGKYAFYCCESLNEIVLPDSVKEIGNWAFAYCYGLENITFGTGLQKIGKAAFLCCTSLTEMEIPQGLKSVGADLFAGCSALEKVTLPYGMTATTENMFGGCMSLTEVVLPTTIKTIGNSTFSDCGSLKKIELPVGVETIGQNAFAYCTALEEVVLPNTLKTIGAWAFRSCESLQELVLPESLTTIGQYAFEACSALQEIEFPSTLTTIDHSAFTNCSGLQTVTIPSNVTTLGSGVFIRCKNLESAVVEAAVTELPESFFYECSALSDVSLPDSLTKIGNSAFYNCALESVEIPDSVTEIDNYAFYGNPMTEITLPASLENLGYKVFDKCAKLTEIAFTGNAPAIDDTAFNGIQGFCYYPADNKTWTDDALQQYGGSVTWIARDESGDSEGESGGVSGEYPDAVASGALTETMSWWLSKNGTLTITGKGAMGTIEAAPWQEYENSITSVVIEEGVTEVGAWLFYEYPALTSVKIADSVKDIRMAAFYGSHALTDLDLGSGVENLEMSAFCNCWALPEVIIPASVKSLADGAFSYCSDLETIKFMGDAPTIGNSFGNLRTTAYYPVDNKTWTLDVLQPYGGRQITWKTWTADITPPRILSGSVTELCGGSTTATVQLNTWDDKKIEYFEILWSSKYDSMHSILDGANLSDTGYYAAECDVSRLPDGVYTVTILAVDGAENRSPAFTATVTVDNTAPWIGNLNAKMVKGMVQLTWEHEEAEDFSSFRIHRKDAAGIADVYDEVGKTTGNIWYDTERLYDGTYSYYVTVEDMVGNVRRTAVVNVDIDATAPEAPTNVAAVNGDGYIQISWQYPNRPDDFQEFRVYRSASENGVYELLGTLDGVVFFDNGRTANTGVQYYYYITAADTNGNESAASTVVTGMIGEDERAPEIFEVWPGNGITLCNNAVLSLSAYDNYCLSGASVTLTAGEESTAWGQSLAEFTNQNLFKFDCDLTEMAGGEYELTFAVWDAAGNLTEVKSDITIHAYTAPAVPQITVEEGYKTATLKLEYAGDTTLLDHFTVYSCDAKGGNKTSVTVLRAYEYTTQIPLDETVYFVVEAQDMYGATAESEIVAVNSLPTESEPPIAVIMPENLISAVGTEVMLYGSNSTDNDLIVSYEWDFGDGTTGSGDSCSHTYTETGAYIVKLTVTDYCGNVGTAEKVMNVYAVDGVDADHSLVTVRVVNAYAEGTPGIANAEVRLRSEDGLFDIAGVTDENGCVMLIAPNTDCRITANAGGYLASERHVTVKPDENSNFEYKLGLSPIGASVVDGSLKVEPMTYQEIIDAGIDVSDPANNHVWKYAITLEFTMGAEEEPVRCPVEYCVNERGNIVGGGGGGGWIEIEWPFNVDDPTPEIIRPEKIGVFPISEKIYLVIYGDAHWLKEMFNVELVVANNSYMDEITDCTASLQLPEGLSLAAMLGEQQTSTIDLGTIGVKGTAASTKKAAWYVRGDEKGEYNISAVVNGKIAGEPFENRFTTDSPVTVYAGDALHMYIKADQYAAKGLKYFVEFELKNVTTDRELYNVSMNVLSAHFQDKYDVESAEYIGEDLNWRWEDGAMLTSEVLRPGESLYGKFQMVFEDDIVQDRVRYMLTDAFAQTLEGSTTEVPVSFEYRDNTFMFNSSERLADIKTNYIYDDSYFAKPSNTFNPDLAYSSICLAASAYNSVLAPWADYAAETAGKNVRDLLEKLEFENVEIDSSTASYGGKPENDSIAAAIANKKITVEGEDYTVIAVALRGGGYEREWHDNFVVGDDTDHDGFARASRKVLTAINEYIAEQEISGNVKFWITGFSRSAATANLVAARIAEGAVTGEAITGGAVAYDFEDLYAYCFATPANTVSFSAANQWYAGIYSVINPVDAVPMVAPGAWGYTRYGKTLYLPSAGLSSAYSTYNTLLENTYAYVTGGDYELDEFQMKKLIDIDVDVYHDLGTISGMKVDVELLADDNNSGFMQEAFLVEYVDILANDGFQDRDHYLKYYQNAISDLIGTICGDPEESEKLINGLGESLDWGKYALLAAYGAAKDVKEGWQDLDSDLVKELWGALKDDIATYISEYESDDINISYEEVVNLLEDLKDVLLKCIVMHPNYTATMFCNLESIGGAHYSELYLSWLRLIQSENSDADGIWKELLSSSRPYRKAMINCPVDVDVYELRGGERVLVAQIRGKQVQKIEGSTIITYVDENDQMIVYLPFDAEYEFEITAVDSGELNFSIMETETATGEKTKINYYAIDIEAGDVLTGAASAVDQQGETAYVLTGADGETIEPDEQLDDEDVIYHTVTTAAEGAGFTVGDGVVRHGEFTKLLAVPMTEQAFRGWYLGDELVSTETEYRLSVQSDLMLTAKFGTHTIASEGAVIEWAADYSGAKVVAKCAECGETVTAACEISCETEGNKITFTAVGPAFADGTTLSDTQTIEVKTDENGDKFVDLSLASVQDGTGLKVVIAAYTDDGRMCGLQIPDALQEPIPFRVYGDTFKVFFLQHRTEKPVAPELTIR